MITKSQYNDAFNIKVVERKFPLPRMARILLFLSGLIYGLIGIVCLVLWWGGTTCTSVTHKTWFVVTCQGEIANPYWQDQFKQKEKRHDVST